MKTVILVTIFLLQGCAFNKKSEPLPDFNKPILIPSTEYVHKCPPFIVQNNQQIKSCH